MDEVKKLTKKELKQLKVIMGELEWEAYYPLKWQTSAYAEAKMFDYDEDYIDIELKYGIDGEVHYTESIRVDRETMVIIN